MKLEEGKCYISRDGRVTNKVKLRNVHESCKFKYSTSFIGSNDEYNYESDGSWWSEDGEHRLDLIAEYTGE